MENIKELRKQLKLTQEKLAQRLGVSAMTVRRWESGKNNPSSLALRELERLKETICKTNRSAEKEPKAG